MYWLGILVGAALGLVGGVTGLILAFAAHGLTPLFAPANFNAWGVHVVSILGPAGSIVSAAISLKKQMVGEFWLPELAGMLMFTSGLAMVGFLGTSGMTMLPGAMSLLGGLIILLATDELKPKPA